MKGEGRDGLVSWDECWVEGWSHDRRCMLGRDSLVRGRRVLT